MQECSCSPLVRNNLLFGGTVTGDLIITGDLSINGNLNFGDASVDTLTAQGAIIVDATLAEAFLVRKDADGGDILAIDTLNSIVTLTGTDLVWGSGKAVTAGAYSIGRDTDTTNQMHFNVPTGASFEWSINDVARMILAPTTMSRTQGAATTGSLIGFLWTGAAHTGLTVAEQIDWKIDLARTVTFTTGGGTIAAQRAVLITAPTYAAGSATTITEAGTLVVSGSPIAGTNVTLTRSQALWVQSGSSLFNGGVTIGHGSTTAGTKRLRVDQTDALGGAAVMEFGNGTHNFFLFLEAAGTGGRFQMRTDSTREVVLQDNASSGLGGVGIGTAVTGNYKMVIASGTATSGTRKSLTVVSAPHTGQTAGAEVTDVYFDFTRVKTWATGAITTQREFLIDAPTYAFAGASTVTNAATVAIVGAPNAGTNATITNAYALWAQSGSSRFDGNVLVGAVAAGASATKVVALSNGATAPSTSVDLVQLYAVDLSAGNATLGLYTETAVAADAALVSTHSLTVKVNNTNYKLMLVTA